MLTEEQIIRGGKAITKYMEIILHRPADDQDEYCWQEKDKPGSWTNLLGAGKIESLFLAVSEYCEVHNQKS